MPRFVAFLRAINVGGHNLKMDHLRELFQSLGLTHVETFIASGNVAFEANTGNVKTLEKKIETCLDKALGYEVAAFIRTTTELAAISKYRSFPKSQLDMAMALNIGFLADPLDKISIQKLMTLRTDIDDFHVHEREIYWLCLKKQSDSKISGAVIERTLGMKTTLRSINTVNKLAQKYTL